MGQLAVGVLAIGQLGAGLLAAVGQVAFAWHAVAQFAAGVGMVYGQLAAGPTARGAVDWTSGLSVAAVVGAWLACAVAMAARAHAYRRGIARLLPAHLTAIRDTAPGRVLLRGRVIPTQTVDAPVSGRACVAYDVRRLRVDRAPRAERGCEDFLLDDGSGRARVVAADVELVLAASRTAERVLASAHVAPDAGRPAHRTPSPPTEVRLERLLLPGDRVLIAATAMRSVSGAAASRPGAARVNLVLHGGATGPVLVTNREPQELRAEAGIALLLAAAMGLLALVAPLV